MGLPTSPIVIRLVRIELEDGNFEVLMTSLLNRNQHPERIFKDLYHQRWFVEEDYKLMKDHVHMCLSIPPKLAVSNVVGHIKGKSAISIARNFKGRQRNFTGEAFWDTPHSLMSLLAYVDPQLAEAAHVVNYSSSSHIHRADTNALLSDPSPSFHLYFEVANGRDMYRYGSALFDSLWLMGLDGHIRVGAVSALVRGPLDNAVWSPERLNFCAGAVVDGALYQALPPPQYVEGGVVAAVLAQARAPIIRGVQPHRK